MVGSDEAAPSGQSANSISPAQCRAARGLLDWSVTDLAARSNLDEGLVRNFEEGAVEVPSGRIEALRSALMAGGAVFTSESGSGVRLGRAGHDEGTRLGDLTTENDR